MRVKIEKTDRFFVRMAVGAMISCAPFAAWAQEGATDETNLDEVIGESAANAGSEESQFLRLGSLEQVFLKRMRNRELLALKNRQLQNQLKEADKEEKKQIMEDMGKVQNQFKILNTAMKVIFPPSNPRQYEYNPVQSTVYLRVGNLEQTFVRAIQVRDKLLQTIQARQQDLEELDEGSEEAEKAQAEIDNLTQRYQVVAASLQIVFDVVPQRDYQYNPKNSTLYLQISEEEADKIQQRIEKAKTDAEEASTE